MYRIVIKGQAEARNEEGDEIIGSDLEVLDGIDCQDEFVEYMDGDESYYEDLEDGYMDFHYEDGMLMTHTTYSSKRELTKEELDSLIEYTTGQWSDGIGEGFEQMPCFDDGETSYYISAWQHGQEIEVIQTKI